MKCEKCGKELEKGVKFCTSCGNKIKSKKNIPIIIGIIILVIFIIAIILLNILGKIYMNEGKTNIKDDVIYDNFEEKLEDAASNYIFKNKYKLEEGTLSNVIISDLKKDNLIFDDLTNKCEGYVLIEAEYDEDGDEDYDYDAYISCGKYETKGYNKEYAKKSSISSVSNIKEENINNESDIYSNFSYIKNLKETDLLSVYEFKKDYKAADIEGEFTTTYKIRLELYNNNIMHIITEPNPQPSLENCYGTYEIVDNVLTIKRLTYYDDYNKEYTDMNLSYWKDNTNYTDSFYISNDQEKLSSNNYIGMKVDNTYSSVYNIKEGVTLIKLK